MYTPHTKKHASEEVVVAPTQPEGERDESVDTRPGAPQRPDIPDRSNPPSPVDLVSGKSVSEEDTKEMTLDDATPPGSAERKSTGIAGQQPGEDRRTRV